MVWLLPALILLLPQSTPPAQQAPDVDPAVRAVVERFFATQQAEDAEGYLALWSPRANTRPRPEQLQFIFESGDDRFIDLSITRASVAEDAARVRVSVTRVRTDTRLKNPDGSPRLLSTRLRFALSLVRESGEWKIVREGAPADELAQALIQAEDPAERRRIRESEPDLLTARLVEAIARQADSFAQTGQYKAAQVIYERSLEVAAAIGDRKAEGQAIQNIANSLYFQRDFAGALRLYERRLGLEREIDNEEGIASALLGVATIRYSDHEYGRALEAYREALAIQETLGDAAMISTTLISTGNVQYLQGDYEAAIADYRRAEELKRQYSDLSGAATALEGLGRVYSAQGDFAAALAAFSGVLDERRERNDIARQALVLQSIGEIHFRLGNTDQARATFDESRRHFETANDMGSAGRVLQGAALNELVAGRFPVAEKAYAGSIAQCTKAADQECIARAQVGLAFALAAQQKLDEAVTSYGRSIASFGALKMADAEARARIGLADVLLGQGDAAGSLAEAARARHTGVALQSDDLLWRALVAEARAERKLKRHDSAMGAAKAALLAVERMSAAALDRPGQAVSRDTTAAFATMAVMQAEAGDAAGACATAERMRAHALRAWLAPHEREIARGMTASEREEERRLATELATLLVRRDRQKELPNPDARQLETLASAIDDVARRRRAARDALFGRLPELRAWRGLGRPATADDLGQILAVPGRLVIQFVVDDHDLVVIALRAGSSAAHVIPMERQILAERIAAALDRTALADARAWRTGSAALWQLLPPSVHEAVKGATSVVIVPDDVLWRLPFEAMPVGEGYLADVAPVTYATSIGAMVLAPVPPAAGGKRPVLVVHSPDLPAGMVDTLKATAPTWILRPAETAAAEATVVSPEGVDVPAVVRAGAQAHKDAFRVEGESLPYAAVHIGAPFRVNSASPLFSPLLLAARPPSTSIEDTDGRAGEDAGLMAREVFMAGPLAPVVIFSDPGALARRDAAASLAPISWAWRSAGASTMILRRWGGDEGPALEVVERFHDGLRDGRTPEEALHAALAALRRTQAGRAPGAWVGWMLVK